jgi:hypothetical protein
LIDRCVFPREESCFPGKGSVAERTRICFLAHERSAQRRRLFLFTIVKYLVNASSSDLFQYWRKNYSACGAACDDARLRRK